MSTLSDAIEIVEAELETADRACGTYADDPHGWHARNRVEMSQVISRLETTLAARINDKWDGARVRIVGIASSSTEGVRGALQNWLRAARLKVDATPALAGGGRESLDPKGGRALPRANPRGGAHHA